MSLLSGLVKTTEELTPYVTSRGAEYYQLHQYIPLLEPLYMNWEKNYDGSAIFYFVRDNSWIPIVSVIAYCLMLALGPKMMEKRERFDLRYPLAYWNLLLAVFSFIGMIRTVPHFFLLMQTHGWQEVVCGAPEPLYGDGAVGFWVAAFVLSKVFELIDTLFIVLRKRPLIFLHWYHHITVLLFTWFCYSYENPGIVFVAMNYTVHAVMYGYYYLMAMKMKPSWMPPQAITVMQISQMVVGVAVATNYVMTLRSGGACHVHVPLLYSCAVMYSSYLYLFASFFVKRFIFGGAKAPKAVKTA